MVLHIFFVFLNQQQPENQQKADEFSATGNTVVLTVKTSTLSCQQPQFR